MNITGWESHRCHAIGQFRDDDNKTFLDGKSSLGDTVRAFYKYVETSLVQDFQDEIILGSF